MDDPARPVVTITAPPLATITMQEAGATSGRLWPLRPVEEGGASCGRSPEGVTIGE
jgi:hypothetical protein